MRFEPKKAVMSDGAVLNCVEAGEGRPLVYLNGFGEDVSSARRLLEKLSGSYRCVTFDHRGYGGTEPTSNAGVERSAQDLRELLGAWGLENVALVGYSMGGSVAFSYAQQFGMDRIGRLVLLDTAPKLINEDGWELGLWQGRYSRFDFERDLQTIVDNVSLFNLSFYARAAQKSRPDAEVRFPDYYDFDGWIEKVAEITKVRVPFVKKIFSLDYSAEKVACARNYWETMTGGDWRDVLETITIPTLCLFADPGSFYCEATARHMAERIPNAEAIQDACHTCPKDNWAEVAEKIEGFLSLAD